MNNRGNVSLMALVVLGVVTLYLGAILGLSTSLKPFVKNYEKTIVDNHHYRSALSRVIASLQEDILASGPFSFPDLDQEVFFEEISRKEEETYISEFTEEDEETSISFEVLMDTTIYIDFYGGESGYIHLYDPSGELIIAGSSGSWEIDSANWGYGDYTAIMSGSVTISCTQVVERLVKVDSYKLKVLLTRGKNEVTIQKSTTPPHRGWSL